MALVSVVLCSAASPTESAVRHNAAFVDLTVLACWPSASEAGHSIAIRTGDLAVLVVDMPPTMHVGPPAVGVLLANLQRFFALDGAVLLTPSELIADPTPGRLEESIAGTAPGGLGRIGVAEAGLPFDHSAPGARQLSRLVRATRRGGRPDEWCDALERVELDWYPSMPPVGRSLVEPRAGSSPWRPIDRPGERRADVETGVWNPHYHSDNLYLDAPPFRFVLDRFQPSSVLDIGCGLGGYVDMFVRWGVGVAFGVDGFQPADELLCHPQRYRQRDLRQHLDLGHTFDLVICTEVAEHLDERYESVLIGSIARHASETILFSAARPGQPGVGHVNCKPVEYWVDVWRASGWRVDNFATCATRSLSTYLWFRRNLLVLVPAGTDDTLSRRFDAHPAGEFEARGVPWFGQPPRVHVHSFDEPLPSIAIDD